MEEMVIKMLIAFLILLNILSIGKGANRENVIETVGALILPFMEILSIIFIDRMNVETTNVSTLLTIALVIFNFTFIGKYVYNFNLKSLGLVLPILVFLGILTKLIGF